METRHLAMKYAEALLANVQPGMYSEAYEDIHTFSELMRLDPRIKLLLGNPAIPDDSKKQLIRDISQRAGFLEVSGNFLLVLFEKQRIGIIASIAECLHESIREFQGKVAANVTTAVELTRAQSAQLEAKLCGYTGKIVEMEVTVDPSLIGGIVVRVGDKIIDASIINALSGMKESLIEGW